MGKRRRNKGNKGVKQRPDPCWKDIVKSNELLEKFYKSQGIVASDEWDVFLKYCRRNLPSTFRITKMRGHAKDLLKSLKDGYISKLSAEDLKNNTESNSNEDDEESEENLVLEPINWYPDELAWNSNLSRRFIRRSEVLKKLHRFLVEDSECGAITRQEAVSMIPPMLLDVQPHHLVLDMCAAPGSKTAQIIEMMHSNDAHEIPTGAVLANDADHKRCYMLTHQAKRLNTPCVVITNHDASIYPKLYAKEKDGVTNKLLAFDRVLCDVPCSGDGTLRKNPLIWHRWTPHQAVSLHRLQMRILLRGLELLKVGGRLVYSTCSFNPIENEAVLAGVLNGFEEAVELVDCSQEIPNLKRRPGMKHWKVFDRKGNEFENFAAVKCSPTEGFKETMFPPSPEVADKLKLERCLRIYPHLQNTGGFFVAVLEKKAELPWQKAKRARNTKYLPWETDKAKDSADKTAEKATKESELPVLDEEVTKTENQEFEKSTEDDANEGSGTEQDSSASPAKKFKRGMIKEDPYFFLDDSDQDMAEVRKFYDLSNSLPSDQFLVRSTGYKKRHVYLVSQTVHDVIKENQNLKVINTGVRIVTRSPFKAGVANHGTEYRLVQDGLHLIQQYIGKRIIQVTGDDLITLLVGGNDADLDTLSTETKKQLSEISMGCVLWRYKSSDNSSLPLTTDIWICGHSGRKVIQSMLSKEERKHFLRLLGVPIPSKLQEKVKGPSWGDEPKEEAGDDTISNVKKVAECDSKEA